MSPPSPLVASRPTLDISDSCQRTWGASRPRVPAAARLMPARSRTPPRESRKGRSGMKQRWARGCRVSNRPAGVHTGVDLGQAQLGRDGDVAAVGIDRQRRGLGGLAGRRSSGNRAEQPEPRPFAEQRDKRAVVADRSGDDPARALETERWRPSCRAGRGRRPRPRRGSSPPRGPGRARAGGRPSGRSRPGTGRDETATGRALIGHRAILTSPQPGRPVRHGRSGDGDLPRGVQPSLFLAWRMAWASTGSRSGSPSDASASARRSTSSSPATGLADDRTTTSGLTPCSL